MLQPALGYMGGRTWVESVASQGKNMGEDAKVDGISSLREHAKGGAWGQDAASPGSKVTIWYMNVG